MDKIYLFLVYFSYAVPIISTIVFALFIVIVPEWRGDRAKRAILWMLLAWLVNLVAMTVWELFYTQPPYPVCDFFYYLSGLILFPFFYNYLVIVTTGQSLSWLKLTYWYSLPILLFMVWSGCVLTLGELPFTYSISEFCAQFPAPEMLLRLVALLVYAGYILLICTLGGLLYVRYKRNIADDFSYTTNISMHWYVWILLLFFIFASTGWVSSIFVDANLKVVLNVLTTFLIGAIVLCSLCHKTAYSEKLRPMSDIQQFVSKECLNNSIVSKTTSVLNKRMKVLFEEEKIWRHTTLSAEDVVHLLGTNRTYLSQVIKKENVANFRTYINEYRIKDAQKILSENPTISMTELCELTGFASISSFNLWFKKITGMSPSAYKQKYNPI